MNWLQLYTLQHITPWMTLRSGETKLGQKTHFPTSEQPIDVQLQQFKQQNGRFVLLGINEDIGPQANLGRGGSGDGFEASVKHFINFQSNQYLKGDDIFIVGEIQTQDLQTSQGVEHIRQAVAELDNRVIELVSMIKAAGLEPIVIGGGHNNAFGLLTACQQVLKAPMAAVNLDPHSDFRSQEGRHSGNGFSYAAVQGALADYHVLGLHEQKNNATNLKQLTDFGASWHTFQEIWIRREISLEQALQQITDTMRDKPLGLELDVDAIAQFPSSAETSAGIPLLDAAYYLSYMARHCHCQYLHIAEAAPSCHPISEAAGYRQVGQSLSELVLAYIQGRKSQ